METTTATTENQTPARSNANEVPGLEHFTGSQQFYRYVFGTILTEGAKECAEKFSCFWFLDVIASYQGELRGKEEFQVWTLKRTKDAKFKVTCDDGNGNILRSQVIPFSDFEHDEFTLWLVGATIMLPTEY